METFEGRRTAGAGARFPLRMMQQPAAASAGDPQTRLRGGVEQEEGAATAGLAARSLAPRTVAGMRGIPSPVAAARGWMVKAEGDACARRRRIDSGASEAEGEKEAEEDWGGEVDLRAAQRQEASRWRRAPAVRGRRLAATTPQRGDRSRRRSQASPAPAVASLLSRRMHAVRTAGGSGDQPHRRSSSRRLAAAAAASRRAGADLFEEHRTDTLLRENVRLPPSSPSPREAGVLPPAASAGDFVAAIDRVGGGAAAAASGVFSFDGAPSRRRQSRGTGADADAAAAEAEEEEGEAANAVAGGLPSLAERLRADFVRECEDCFFLHATSASGRVPVELLPVLLRSLGQYWSAAALRRLERRLHLEGLTTLSFPNFLAVATAAREQQGTSGLLAAGGRRVLLASPALVHELLQAFHLLSRHRRNGLRLQDVKHYLTRIGPEPLSEDEWNTLTYITADRRSSFGTGVSARGGRAPQAAAAGARGSEGAVGSAAAAAPAAAAGAAAPCPLVAGEAIAAPATCFLFDVPEPLLTPSAVTLSEGAFISMFADDVEEFL